MTDKDEIKFAIRYLKQGLKSKRTPPLYEELMKELGFERKDKVIQELEKENLTKAKICLEQLVSEITVGELEVDPNILQQAEQFISEVEK